MARDVPLSNELTRLYYESESDPDFVTVSGRFHLTSDADLADLIEADGRLRLRLHLPVDLDRYLTAVPDLEHRRDPLDAAIDMALRRVAQTGRADQHAIDALIESFPRLERPIREAAALNNAVWSTARIRGDIVESNARDLPCDFGPVMQDDRHRYELTELLGEGAFGQVYLAVDRQLSEEDHPALVSIKLLAGYDRSPWARRQLIDEANKARRINHANVVLVLDRGVSDRDEDFIVYEYVAGGDLARWAHRGDEARTARHLVQLMLKIARGVHAAHMAGLVHCDLKPGNIMLTAEAEPKVADFGIAIRTDEQMHALHGQAEEEVRPLGNLAFMSPEQFRMEPGALTIPSDVFALGGMLFWMLTGELPNGATPEEIKATHDPVTGRASPPPVSARRSDADRDLDAICRRAMAVKPEQRYSSAGSFADDLESWLRLEPIPWMRPSPLRRARLWIRRRPGLAASLGVVTILLIAGVFALQNILVTQARLETEKSVRRQFTAELTTYMVDFDLLVEGGELPNELLSNLWLVEWLYGTTTLGQGLDRRDVWNRRIDVIRQYVDKAIDDGRADHLDTLIWETALAFWLIRNGAYDEAEQHLDRVRGVWARIIPSSDPWLADLAAMDSSLVVFRTASAEHVERDELNELRIDHSPRLQRAARRFDRTHRGSPVHRMVLDALVDLYGPRLLDDDERVDEFRTQRKAFDADDADRP
jgi:serine/threonine protein kinase